MSLNNAISLGVAGSSTSGWPCAYPRATRLLGFAKLTTTLQTSITIHLPSNQVPQSLYPDVALTVPSGATIQRIAFRLPKSYDSTNNNFIYGHLASGATLIGTTGENLKVGQVHTNTGPVITCASSAYTANASAKAERLPAAADVTASNLITTGSTTQLYVLCSNAGNTAAGNGIRVSSGEAFIIVEVVYTSSPDVASYEEMGYQIKP